jgi:hypothetical protein
VGKGKEKKEKKPRLGVGKGEEKKKTFHLVTRNPKMNPMQFVHWWVLGHSNR